MERYSVAAAAAGIARAMDRLDSGRWREPGPGGSRGVTPSFEDDGDGDGGGARDGTGARGSKPICVEA